MNRDRTPLSVLVRDIGDAVLRKADTGRLCTLESVDRFDLIACGLRLHTIADEIELQEDKLRPLTRRELDAASRRGLLTRIFGRRFRLLAEADHGG